MLQSYWFVYYVVRYINRDGDFCEIKGNSVHGLPTKSFLPGTVKRVIDDSHYKQLFSKVSPDSRIDVVLESFGAIDKEGFDDFNTQGSCYMATKTDFNLSGREFVHKVRVTIA
ncbi:MAG: hypothetical protein HYT62_02180 [Candidatus Yanofskybacteria bacterium]|nr:hypothetical protein [Candidatus Yanofskybacteria bacterium]